MIEAATHLLSRVGLLCSRAVPLLLYSHSFKCRPKLTERNVP